MVAWKATFLSTQETLVKFKKHHIDLIDIVPSVCNEVLNDDIKLVAPGQGIASAADKISGFFQIQF